MANGRRRNSHNEEAFRGGIPFGTYIHRQRNGGLSDWKPAPAVYLRNRGKMNTEFLQMEEEYLHGTEFTKRTTPCAERRRLQTVFGN